MLATDEDAVICDFAETYHVLDIGALDLPLAATLAAGLAPDSRIRRKQSGEKLPTNTWLLAAVFDRLAVLCWLNSADGSNNVNYPRSVLAYLEGESAAQGTSDTLSFASPAEFEAYRAKLIGEINHVD